MPQLTAPERVRVAITDQSVPVGWWLPMYVAPTAGVIQSFLPVSPDSLEAAERRVMAQVFAQVGRNIRGVREVWLRRTRPNLEVVAIIRDVDLDRELELRGIFIDLACSMLDPTVGELSVYAEDDAPDWVREGERLT